MATLRSRYQHYRDLGYVNSDAALKWSNNPSWGHPLQRLRPAFLKLHRTHIAQRQGQPLVIVPPHLSAKLHLKVAEVLKALVVGELSLERLVALLLHGTVVVTAPHAPQPHYLEDLQRLVYSGSSDFKAALRVELTFVEERKHYRCRYLDQPRVLPCPKRVAGFLSAVWIDEQADVAPTLPAHRRKVRTKASLGLSGRALNFALVWPLLRPHSLMAAVMCLLLEQILHLASAPLCSGCCGTRYFFPRRRRREVPVLLRSGCAAQACCRSTSE